MLLLKRLVRALPLMLLSPVLMAVSFVTLLLADLVDRIFRSRPGEACLAPTNTGRGRACPARSSASVVIPNWNGIALLQQYLPSVVEALAGLFFAREGRRGRRPRTRGSAPHLSEDIRQQQRHKTDGHQERRQQQQRESADQAF